MNENIHGALNSCSEAIKRWASNNVGSIPRRVKELQNRISHLQERENGNCPYMELERMETELERLLVKEEVYWKQRSRVDWLRHGDKNTAYFHKHASCRHKRNMIKGLFNANNVFQTDQKEMAKVVTDFYSELFSSRNPSENDVGRA